MSSELFKNNIYNQHIHLQITNYIYIYIYIYKQDLALNNSQGLICHKMQPTNQPDNRLPAFFYRTCTYLVSRIILVKFSIDLS